MKHRVGQNLNCKSLYHNYNKEIGRRGSNGEKANSFVEDTLLLTIRNMAHVGTPVKSYFFITDCTRA